MPRIGNRHDCSKGHRVYYSPHCSSLYFLMVLLVPLGLMSSLCCHCTFFIPTTLPTLFLFSSIVSILVNMKCCFLEFVFAFLYYQITWNTLSLTLSCAYLLQGSIRLNNLHIFMQVILWSEGWFRKPNDIWCVLSRIKY